MHSIIYTLYVMDKVMIVNMLQEPFCHKKGTLGSKMDNEVGDVIWKHTNNQKN